MAGDWIKMRVSLLTHPKVIRIASAIKADRLRAIGAIFAVWSIFDQHSEDGRLDGYTPQAMDETVGCKGITAAMEAVRWLEVDEDGIYAVEYTEHNGASAKRRANDNDRKKSARDADKTARGSWNSDGQTSASEADEKEPREELEKKNTSCSVRASAPRPSKRCPDSFEITPEMTEWAASNAPGVSLQRETAKFRDHTFSKAITDWPATWRNWVRRASEGTPRRNGDDPFAGAH